MNTVQDARWQKWTDAFLAGEAERLNQQQAELLVQLIILDHTDPKTIVSLAEDVKDQFAWQVGQAHAKRIGLKLSDTAMLFLTASTGNPGEIVMYLHAIRRWQQLNGEYPVTIQNICESIFPFGYPTEEVIHAAWDDQKLRGDEREHAGTDNYLDTVIDA